MASFNSAVIARVAAALYDVQLGNANMTWALNAVDSVTYGGSVSALVQDVYNRDFKSMTYAQVAALVVKNAGITTGAADAATYVAGQLSLGGAGNEGATLVNVLNQYAGLTNHPVAAYNVAAAAFNNEVTAALAYASSSSGADQVIHTPQSIAATTFTLVAEKALGADVMHITGGMDVRIDFTNPANQVRGLDLDGDGLIETNGIENVSSNFTAAQRGANFEIVDAYSRDPLNHTDTANNFLGDIAFDGTGFKGDGVNTNGNVFLGGLGHDVAFGGDGNDFLAGGGIAQNHGGMDTLRGGRNADFFFAEFSGIDATDGGGVNGAQTVFIDGGNTADDVSAGVAQSKQDSDWLLFEASDDDEPVRIVLDEVTGTAVSDNDGGIVQSRSGETMDIDDVENVDASGNLYGFLDGMDVQIGGRATDDRDAANSTVGHNYGYGSSAQLNITGSGVANIIIAGYDNDYVDGGAGADLLMGGNLANLNNPNLAGITNDGRDELYGGADGDNVVLELDKGVADGGDGNDTLWLTNYTVGRKASTETASAASILTDSKIRIDLGHTTYKGYRGDTLGENTTHADEANSTSTSTWVSGTADQSNYASSWASTKVTGFESVIATGLGAIDYKAAGSNSPELLFTNQQNLAATTVDLELRGTDGSTTVFTSTTVTTPGAFTAAQVDAFYADYVAQVKVINVNAAPISRSAFGTSLSNGGIQIGDVFTTSTVSATAVRTGNNTLYAAAGDDILEGRTGDDNLSGGEGNDDFVFRLTSTGGGDGVDVIHRQTDLVSAGAATNLTDGTFGRDFGLESTQTVGVSVLQVSITKVGGNAASDELTDVVNFVNGITTGVKVGATFEKVELSTDLIKGATTYVGLVDALNKAIAATAFATDLHAELQTDGVTIFITDAKGRELADSNTEVVGAGVVVNQKANTQTENVFTFGEPVVQISQDRLIYKAYEDRLDNEGVDDDGDVGSTISLGIDSYAQDLVVDFAADGTRIAEDQQYAIQLTNLAVEDRVTVDVNGVKYQLQVGVNVDGSLINGESNNAFVTRFAGYINSFLDDDTAAGALNVAATASTLLITQRPYNDGEQTVFMRKPVVTIDNLSGGQVAESTVTNISQHEVHLLNFDGRNGALNQDNVLFVGEEFTNRSILETAAATGGVLDGSDSMVIYVANNSAIDNVKSAATDEGLNKSEIAFNALANKATQFTSNFSVHGDDLLIGGDKADTINGGTGDDRVIGSRGADKADGGKDLYLVDGVIRVLNDYEANQVDELLTTVSIEKILQNQTGTALADGFEDTLLFQQGDFGNVGVGGARFYVTLDSDVNRPNGGAGTVAVTEAGVNTGTTAFTNFEHIRTVSGDGTLKGQGSDTLDFAALSTKTGGVFYNLSNNSAFDDNQAGDGDAGGFSGFPGSTDLQQAGPGSVLINFGDDLQNLSDDSVTPDDATDDINPNDVFVSDRGANDQLFATVDGVENIIGGDGGDGVYVDETEAGKENVFSLGLGNDVVIYGNAFDTGAHALSSQVPTVTLQVGTGTDTDTVVMTGGRVGLDVAKDTLTGVEVVSFALDADNLDESGAAASSREDDVLDVSRISGVTVDYTNGYITKGGVTELAGVTQLIVAGLGEFENVVGSSGGDALIIADSMSNSREDWVDGDANNIDADALIGRDVTFDSFLNYDFINDAVDDIKLPKDSDTKADDVDGDGQVYDRMSIAELRVVGRTGQDINPFGEANIPEAFNADEYHFKLGDGQDTVDYSDESGLIAAVVNFNAADDKTGNPTRVFVSQTNTAVFNDEAGDRIDLLDSVENIVASQGDSIIDLTNATSASSVLYSFGYDAKNRTTVASLDRDIHTVRITGANSVQPLENLNLIEYRGEDLNADKSVDQADALWTRIEGSDFNEYVQLTGWEDGQSRTINLRGGNNEVNYNERTRGIYLNVISVDTANTGSEATDNRFVFTARHLDETGAQTAAFDSITGYNKQNNIAAGTMRIEASQGDDDFINFTSLASAFILGRQEGGDDVVDIIVGGVDYGVTLSGFEYLWDGTQADTYTITDLSNFVNQLTLIDWAQIDTVPGGNIDFGGSSDRDTVKLTNGSFETAVIRAPISHVITVSNDLRMGDGSANDLQWLGLNDNTLRQALDNDGNLLTGNNSVGFDFQVLDISEVTAVNNLKATAVAGNANDEVIVGDLTKIDGTATGGFTGFNILSFTNASAGTGFKLDVVNDDLLNGSGNKLFETGSVTKLDFSRVSDARALVVSVADDAANIVNVQLVGGSGADTISGGRGNDTLTGGKGNDTLDGGLIAAVGATYTVNIAGVGATSGTAAGLGVISIGGVTLTTVAGAPATELQIAQSQNYAQIADRFEAVSLATWKAALDGAGLSTPEANALVSVTHDGSSGNLVFKFSTVATTLTNTIVLALPAPVAGGDAVLPFTESETTFTQQIESRDTYVFEAKAADNGSDIINSFNATNAATDDQLNFSAFLGAVSVDTTATDFAGTGLDLTGNNVGVAFNKASTLVAADIALATGANVAGKIGVANNGKAVVLVTADDNGVGDVSEFSAYKVYYIQDTDAGAGQTWAVTLVGTINSTNELNAADLVDPANGGDIFS